MEQLKRNETIRRRGRAALVVTCLLITLFSAACGPQVIKGRPPFISISGMALAGEKLSAEFDITNQNGIPMTISMIDITVTVNDVELTRENRSFDLVVGANSTEEIQVDELPDDFTRDLLASLQEGELKSLPFDLNGRVMTAEDGSLRFEQKGHLYPVPGRPGQFRSAVTQAKELRRTEKF